MKSAATDKNIMDGLTDENFFNDAFPENLGKTTQAGNRIKYTATCFNGVTFMAIGRRDRRRHDAEEVGTVPCGLFPACPVVLTGGEECGLVRVISPTGHRSCDRDTWVCWSHAKASLEGEEKQGEIRKEKVFLIVFWNCNP